MMSEKVQSNIDSWKKSLLDITARNQAVNFKRKKSSTLEIIYPSIEELLNKQVNAKRVMFAEMFDDEEEDEEIANLFEEDEEDFITISGIKLPIKDIYSKPELMPAIKNYLRNKKENLIFSNCNNKTQRKILRNLMKKARTFKEENAINVLYVAIGYLEWYESKDSEESHKAPLLFLAAELSQDSFDAPFRITFPEGDLLLNDSLLRKLSQDYKIDISYDTDQEDLSLFEVYQNYKEYIYAKISDKRWKIYDESDLSIFSFSKINMVKDLEENAQRISDNPLIQQLVGDYDAIEFNDIYGEEDIDRIIEPQNYYHILDADSSQEIAIQSAIAGKSFVLQGPPGTGKSQTITNIITELIARNKKVLFVAEKKAALDVVYNNLKKIGLNDYALPIHNSKLDKKEVLRELATTLEKGQHSIDVDGQFSNDQIHKYLSAKNELIEYPKAILQKRYPINKSLYQLYGLSLKYDKYCEVPFNIKNLNKIDDKQLQSIETVINTFFNANSAVNYDSRNHPLYAFKYDNLSIQEKEEIQNEINESISIISSLLIDVENLDLFIINNQLINTELELYVNFLKHMQTLVQLDRYTYNQENVEIDIENYQSLIDLEEEMFQHKTRIEEISDIEITKLDTNKYKRIVKTNNTFMKRLFSSEYRKVRRDCTLYLIESKIKYPDLLNLLNTSDEYNRLSEKHRQLVNKLVFKTEQMNLFQNLSKLRWIKEYRILLASINVIVPQEMFLIIEKYLANKKEYDERINHLNIKLSKYNELYNKVKLHFDKSRLNLDELHLSEQKSYFESISGDFNRIEEILSFNFALVKCNQLKLDDYCEKIVQLEIKKNYIEIFYKRFYMLLVDDYLRVLLPGFNGSTMDAARGNFKDAEAIIQQMAKSNIERNINNGIPNYNGVEGYNIEVSTLRAEANKSRKILPFRVLFSRIPNLITQLKPCLMMSPLSVSTFLRGTNMIFDTVIFDEASQVKPENAIGAIFRAKQVIVTGDKEQLPPTNFFQNVGEDEVNNDDNYDTTSFDSILEVSSSFIHSIKLRWHYRSKFEELIRPSNKEIYKDLVSFPSISKPNEYEGIKYVYVNGLYSERKNEVEADKVINTLADIIETYGINKSVGIVTFNNEQQLLIERKINHFRRINPHYEEFFTNNENESFFIKNIETVQGDERDIIIISIGYGPDGKGKISMNFGPLNQANGYRRLNVAVTRAKTCLVLVTSIRGTDIDLNRTESRGVRFLKHYLEYAEFGEDDKVDNLDDLANFDSPFEEDVYNELSNLGYDIRKQVGCSGYRIDLAVIDPKNPAKYLLGIECDGATYHSSKSVRDRDRLRQQVLEDRNWTIYRIWSTDWIKNKKSQIEKLDKFIKSIDITFTKSIIDVLPVIPVLSRKKEESKIAFEIYPNYVQLTQIYESNLYANQIQNHILEIIERTTPIHQAELKRIVPYFWGRQKYTNVVDDKTYEILSDLVKKGKIKIKDQYIIHTNTPIKFRETTDNSSRREFINIHPEELKDGIMQILSVTRKMDLDGLHSMIVRLCGFQSSSARIREYIDEIILSLKRARKIRVTDDSFIEIHI